MAIITAPAEVAKLRQSGRIAAQALQAVVRAVRPGVSTAELNTMAESTISKLGGRPSFKGFAEYPTGLCTSINDEVVHGIPSDNRRLRVGDIIGLDIGVDYRGFFTDHAVTVAVGQVTPPRQRLLHDTAAALHLGITAVKAGRRVGDISAAIESHLRPRGYGIVTQLTGHGLGRAVHEPPIIPNVGQADRGPQLVAGMVLAIEPMVTLGGSAVETMTDGWTIITSDRQPAAHFEHTVMVTGRGCDILTTA
ncbi:MAG: type I methionyl aminopeptidase [Patescibacteria group bacterium]